MENKRGTWGSKFGFLMAAIGSAVGLGNIWGFPYKMGKCGGFTFLLVYLFLAVFVGMVIMCGELSLGRLTKKAPIEAYQKVSKKYNWLGWLAVLSPFLIMTFYSVLGGYCIYYVVINFLGLFGNVRDSASFSALLTSPFISLLVLALFMVICGFIVAGGVESGIEKFNKIGMPALAVMLLIIIIKSWTLPNAGEGLKFMLVPGYAVKKGFIEKAPGLIEVLGTAGGQMFFSLSLAMGAMITYGSYLDKDTNIIESSRNICIADTAVALMAGFAVIPAAVANGINNGLAVSEIKLSGPNLLFSTLQDVFYGMGKVGALFGIIFYLLVLIAAVSSAISLMEVVTAHFLDSAAEKGRHLDRKKVSLYVSVAIFALSCLVAADGLGSNGISPADMLGATVRGWNDCWLDFMDTWSEGIMMPIGAMLMAIMIGWELKPDFVLKEMSNGADVKGYEKFFRICITYVVPVIMAFVLAGQMISFFGNGKNDWFFYVFALLVLAGFAAWTYFCPEETPLAKLTEKSTAIRCGKQNKKKK